MSEAAEIEFLERLYLIGEPIEMNFLEAKMDKELLRATEVASAEAEIAATRAGRSVPGASFFCGYSGLQLTTCGCKFSEHFGCAGKRVCPNCREAHHAVARHISEMLQRPVVQRVNSIRARMFRQLRAAAEGVSRGDELRYALAQTDGFDAADIFETRILRSFQRARFLDFRALAEQLEKEKSDDILRALVLAGIRAGVRL